MARYEIMAVQTETASAGAAPYGWTVVDAHRDVVVVPLLETRAEAAEIAEWLAHTPDRILEQLRTPEDVYRLWQQERDVWRLG